MVWQKGMVPFADFFQLFVPSAVNFLVPAIIMSFYISKEVAQGDGEVVAHESRCKRIVGLFLVTIFCAVMGHSFLGMPPVLRNDDRSWFLTVLCFLPT